MMKKTPSPDGYKEQYFVSRQRKTSTAYYFKPKIDLIPEGWSDRFGNNVRVPRDPAKRVGGALERAHAVLDAAELFAEFNRMRSSPASGGDWPHGSLRWLINDWRKSDWFTQEISERTRKSYEEHLAELEHWADETAKKNGGYHPSVTKMTTKGAKAHLDTLKDRPTKQRQRKSAMSCLMKHGIQIGLLESNVVTDVRLSRRKQKRQRPVVLWDQPFVTSFIQIAQAQDLHELAAWVQTMWDIGRRPTDMNGLIVLDDVTRLRLNRGEITTGMYYDPETQAVRGWQSKTNSFGSIPLDALTVELIEKTRPRVETGSNHRHVFIDSRFGEPFTVERFAPPFRKIAKLAGLEGTTPQMGRHSCIMRYKRAGMSTSDIQDITGHFDEATIANFYIVEDDSRIKDHKARRAAAERGQ